tara:strand:+ start:591 stop:890 length:300 start_codon:yes stop_codon:yes gene_type:complete
MKKALLVLVDYKTKALYGTKEYQFSEALTKRMVKYREKNNSPVYFFGKPKMTSWVGKLLDSLGITDRGGINISYLKGIFETKISPQSFVKKSQSSHTTS